MLTPHKAKIEEFSLTFLRHLFRKITLKCSLEHKYPERRYPGIGRFSGSHSEFNRSGFSKIFNFPWPHFCVFIRNNLRMCANLVLFKVDCHFSRAPPNHNNVTPVISGLSCRISIPHLPKLRMQLQWHKREGDGSFSSVQLYDN